MMPHFEIAVEVIKSQIDDDKLGYELPILKSRLHVNENVATLL